MNFGGFSLDNIADKTLRAYGFHICATRYLEKRFPHFTDVTDLELTAEPAVIDNFDQIVTDSEEEVIMKKNKCAAGRKKRLAKLCTPFGSVLSSHPKSSLLLLPRFVPTSVLAFMLAFVPVLVPAPVLALFSCSGSPVVSLSGCVPTSAAVSHCKIPALILPLPILGPLLPLGPSSLRTFKQSVLD